ncbi:MAG TPA: LytTR family DNA-binding domain-containing protein [Bacteroidia bacterium]|nr:LytTR family DNA-binding domain-containing protein [Bacteroidia bacterium]
MNKKYRVLVVEDDLLTQELIKEQLKNFEALEVVGAAGSLLQAKELIEGTDPEIIFLDIDLNGASSFDLIPYIKATCKIVFITASASQAVKAFEVNATDYILKPISLERLNKTIGRITDQMNEGEEDNLSDNSKFKLDQMIMVNAEHKMVLIKVKDINYISAYGNYTKVYLEDNKMYVTYGSIKNWMSRLPKEAFFQIHRSTIVNLLNVIKIDKWTNDTGRLYLKNVSDPFEISRNFFSELKKTFKI